MLRRAQTRGLLAFMLLRANRVVPAEALIEALWGGAEPRTARSQVQNGMSAVRAQLRAHGGEGMLSSGPAGYLLTVAAEQVDHALFELRRREARASAGWSPAGAAAALRAGLELWRGPVLGGASGSYVEPARARLLDRYLTAREEFVELELRLGRHGEVAAEFLAAVDEHPGRERLRGQVMLALYRSGRQVEALRLYREHRVRLAEGHGLDPGPELVALHQAILENDPTLLTPGAPGAAAGEGGAGPARPARHQRRRTGRARPPAGR
ncbi:AfsR/SARP family transcriptional regulator [Nonomuraea monospora]|uniref:AfsR/SARP family transcriptional regulator n=1 Tax=Nonomuraea monospora TaxID=568818 RepID=UPI0031D22064